MRPTTDRVREAMFEVLGDAVEGARVLDLYSGTGALGIEALSRGAEWCDFVEADSKACEVVRSNLMLTALSTAPTSTRCRCRARSPPEGPTTLWWLTRPTSMIEPKLSWPRSYLGGYWLAAGLWLSSIRSAKSGRSRWGASSGASRRYGDTRVTFYR